MKQSRGRQQWRPLLRARCAMIMKSTSREAVTMYQNLPKPKPVWGKWYDPYIRDASGKRLN